MAHDLSISTSTDRAELYRSLLPQVKALLDGEENLIANLANLSAALQQTFNWLWVGFYIRQENELVLGPFQGPVACTRIVMGKGVCGTAAEKGQTIIVPNVDDFPGHIACSSASKSEIVVPLLKDGQCVLVLDVDSAELDSFDSIDQEYLEQFVQLLLPSF